MFTFNDEKIEGKRVGVDSLFIKDFMSRCLGKDERKMFAKLIERAPWISRDKSYMKYRGNPIARTKFFLTRSRTKIHKYGYTGFQWKSMRKYECYKDYPFIERIVDGLNTRLKLPSGAPGFNHVIGTLYEDASDSIGFHSDKTRSWTNGSSVAILSLGATREFHMQCGDDVEVFKCEAGDLFILGWEDNKTYQHSIPVATGAVRPRISLCFRNICESFTREEIDKKVAASERARVHRNEKKAQRIAQTQG